MSSALGIALGNHLWQSTLFAVCIAVLTLFLRRNSAKVRAALWLAASMKFLVPFALLTMLGAQFPLPRGHSNAGTSTPDMILSIGEVTAPLARLAGHREFSLTQMTEGTSPIDTILLIL